MAALLPGWLSRGRTHDVPAWHDLDGWTLDPAYADDPRTPKPGQPNTWLTPSTPRHIAPALWRPDGEPAHGIYHRPPRNGLTDWAAAIDGRMIWRWSGPRMHWHSDLVSPWNPILAQSLFFDEMTWNAPDLGDWELWTGTAITDGQKTGGYFGFRSRRETRRWVESARAADVAFDVRLRRWWAPLGFNTVTAAQGGTLGDHFDLQALAAEYGRVLPPELATETLHELATCADLDVLAAMEHYEEYSPAIRGLALGYPPEVSAGVVLSRAHRTGHPPEAAEYGAYCPFCQQPVTATHTTGGTPEQ